MNYKDIRLTNVVPQEEKDTELSAGFDPVEMSSDEIREYIRKCEEELEKRRKKHMEEAWANLRQAFAEAFDAGLYISFESEEYFDFDVSRFDDINMDKIGKIYFS